VYIGETLLSNALAGALRDRGFEHVWDPATKTLTVTPKGGDAHATRAEAVLQRTGLDATAPLDTSTSEAQRFDAVAAVAKASESTEAVAAQCRALQEAKGFAPAPCHHEPKELCKVCKDENFRISSLAERAEAAERKLAAVRAYLDHDFAYRHGDLACTANCIPVVLSEVRAALEDKP
jgi:hypothetical protein